MNTEFNKLPIQIQDEVKSTLSAYGECTVIFENGSFRVSTGTVIKDSYSNDYKVIGRYLKQDIFSKKEQIINYIENFHDYPINWKGNRNYQLMKRMQELRGLGVECRVKIIDRDVVLLNVYLR